MLYIDFNSKLLGLEDVIVKSIENNCRHTEISIEMQEKAHKYHYVRQAVWAFEAVRKQEQKKFSDTHRRYFKRNLIQCTFSERKVSCNFRRSKFRTGKINVLKIYFKTSILRIHRARAFIHAAFCALQISSLYA